MMIKKCHSGNTQATCLFYAGSQNTKQHGIGNKGKTKFLEPQTHLTTSSKNYVTISEEIKISINTLQRCYSSISGQLC